MVSREPCEVAITARVRVMVSSSLGSAEHALGEREWQTKMATKKELKRRLEAERDRLRMLLGETMEQALAGSRDDAMEQHSGYSTEEADAGTQTFEQELAVGLENHRRGLLREIEDALERFEDGTYGICDNCNEEIEPARLEALPWAKTCLRCRSKQPGEGSTRAA